MRGWLWILAAAIALLGGVMLYRNRDAFKAPTSLTVSDAGLQELKRLEGWRDTPYRDVAGKLTIGYGHLIKVGEHFDKITTAEGERILRADLAIAEAAVRRYVRVPITQGMYDALVSFVFNLGSGNFQSSTLLRKLNEQDYAGAAAEFPRWRLAAGVEIPGLVTRRAMERARFEAIA